jgi:catechol 2,3-dioxygenase-like lactoylglutathione lyase family enzyme
VSNLMDCAPDGFQGTFLRRGDFMLELLAYVDPVTPAQRPRLPNELGFAHISFLVDDAHKTLDRVVQCGGSAHTRLTQSFTTGSETVILFCLDPEGNRIELVSHVDADECDSHAGFLGLDSTGWPARAEFYASDH